jgi:hypothetical protein
MDKPALERQVAHTRPRSSRSRLPDVTDYRRGALLVGGAALLWSSAGLLVRWTETDPWTTLFWRPAFASVALFVWLRMDAPGRMLPAFRLLLALCLAGSMIAFIYALSPRRSRRCPPGSGCASG